MEVRTTMSKDKVYILVNEQSGGGKGLHLSNEVTAYLSRVHIPYILFKTAYKEHAYSLTRRIAKEYCQQENILFLVIGGDGTLHEVIETLVSMNLHIPVGFIPAGTGNDFSRYFPSTKSPISHLKKLLYAKETIQVPILQTENGIAINSFGVGFDAQVVAMTEQSLLKEKLNKIGLGFAVYFINVLRALFRFKTFTCTIETSSGITKTFNHAFLVCVMNNPYFGGGIYMEPSLSLMDNQFSIVVLHDVGFKDIIRFIPKLFQQKHLNDKVLFNHHDISATLHLPKHATMQIDGEVSATKTKEIKVSLASYPFWKI
ncbi:YegS/Rv2252/BmrU family lipid kinase [Granulicatella sp. zg-ZJ]|uniref:diacylglycerol/lipid kinase family protein n=1 Tax=Granulicatella sp. zg-ZJ TaxID=2678504 RepID=UPI0013D6D7A0|nr:YegS/Rv2252/BmrU family lipid kinase [Granulicatella sp. zg-ZJ]NEW62581.1 YegS/Rv2252/BmrU family lipid kinase [Granulicatella sp. zg-ZJ]